MRSIKFIEDSLSNAYARCAARFSGATHSISSSREISTIKKLIGTKPANESLSMISKAQKIYQMLCRLQTQNMKEQK